MQFVIEVNPAQVEALRRSLAEIRRGTETVLARALNKIAVRQRTRIVAHLVEKTGIRPGFVRKAVYVWKAHVKCLVARIRISGKRVPLIWYNARKGATGVTFRAPAGEEWVLEYQSGRKGRGLAEHAFIATMPAGRKGQPGHKGVFLRRTKKRLKIDELYGPTMAVFIGDPRELQWVINETGMGLQHEIAVQTEVLLKQTAVAAGSFGAFQSVSAANRAILESQVAA